MYIVDFMGVKIELEMDEAAHRAIQTLLLAVRMEGGVGLVLPSGDSFKLEGHDWEEKEADAIEKNIAAGKPAKHNLIWSAKDYAELSERFRSDDSTSIYSLAKEFERTTAGIQNQLQKMGLVDQYGTVRDHNRREREPRIKFVYGALGSGAVL
jgi:hypothetical protein